MVIFYSFFYLYRSKLKRIWFLLTFLLTITKRHCLLVFRYIVTNISRRFENNNTVEQIMEPLQTIKKNWGSNCPSKGAKFRNEDVSGCSTVYTNSYINLYQSQLFFQSHILQTSKITLNEESKYNRQVCNSLYPGTTSMFETHVNRFQALHDSPGSRGRCAHIVQKMNEGGK